MKYTFLTLTLFFFASLSASAAEYRREVDPFPMVVSGQPVLYPFLGGINNPKPTLIDFDNDGLFDLFYGDAQGKLAWFKNQGTLTDPNFIVVSQRFAGIDIGSWHRFCDIDGDTDLDLFCDSRFGTAIFYRNESVGDSLIFMLKDSTFGDFVTGSNNTPAFADLDGDDDIDFFFGDIGGNLEFYRNDGDKFFPSFVFITDNYDSVYAFPGAGGSRSPAEALHGFSTINFADLDSDDDEDLFWGDINNGSLYEFINHGSPSLSELRLLTETLLPTSTVGHNHSAFADFDNDNDLDILVGAANGSDIDNLLFFRNSGSPILPVLMLESTNFLSTIDLGSDAMPAMEDLDNDGDMDLLIGGLQGQLNYFENTGSVFAPIFELRSNQFQGINAGFNLAPELVDIDGDEDLDLLIGNLEGKIQFWRNVGTKQSFTASLVTAQLSGIKVDQVASVRAVDLNNDNLLDLVIGEWDFNGFANVLLYQNTGSRSNPTFTLVTKGLIKRTLRELTLPQPYDYDQDGKMDLVLGARISGLQWFKNSSPVGQFPDSMTLVFQPDTVAGSDDGTRLTALFVDLDRDGDDDIITGEEDGGLNFHRRLGRCCANSVGNVDGDAFDQVDIGDLSLLIDYLFITLVPPVCTDEADIMDDGSGSVDISDLTALIDFLFISNQPLGLCR